MVRDAAAVGNDLVAGSDLDVVECAQGVGQALVQEAEVEVHARARVVRLRDAARRQRLVPDAEVLRLAADAVLHVAAQVLEQAPRHRRLEGLAQVLVLEAQVADVCNHKRQHVAALAVVLAAEQATVLLGDGVHALLLRLNVLGAALKQQRRDRKVLGVEALDLGDVEGLELVDQAGNGGRRSGLERVGKLKLLVVHQADGRRRATRLGNLAHGSHSVREVREDDRTVCGDLRDLAHLHGDLRDNAESALRAQDKLIDIRARGDTRHLAGFLDRARWCHNAHTDEQILHVSVDVLLHARGARRDPAADGAELLRVRLVAGADAVLGELLLQTNADDAGLEPGHHVDVVDPEDAIHLGGVERHNHAGLSLRAEHRAGDRGAASEGDQDDVVLDRRLDNCLHVVVAEGEDDQIRNTARLAVAQSKDLLASVSVRAEHAVLGISRDSAVVAHNVLHEGLVGDGGRDGWQRGLRGRELGHVHAELGLHPLPHVRQDHVTDGVPVTQEHDLAILVQLKVRVLVAPPVPPKNLLPLCGKVHTADLLLLLIALAACCRSTGHKPSTREMPTRDLKSRRSHDSCSKPVYMMVRPKHWAAAPCDQLARNGDMRHGSVQEVTS
eukprot:m.219490 g.219490  ORF g.219490 m.219490 type:complete len:613 (+) comp10175_c0_seq1:214-2052(+)